VTEPDRVEPGDLAVAAGPESAPAAAEHRGLMVALLAGVAALGVVRWWQIGGRAPVGWNDTADFVSSSQAPWLSVDLWAGERSVGAPLLLKLVGGDLDAYVLWQAVLAAGCWAALAVSVATVVADRRARWCAGVAVLGFSVTVPVTMWERSVLSESLAVSLLALVVAAGLQLARGPSAWRVTAVLVALALWLATRDSHAAVALVGGAAAVGVVAVSRLRSPPGSTGWHRPLAVLGAGALALGLLVGVGSSQGERHAFPMRNVFEVRVLPFPDRVRWFADHGMPQAEVFLGPDAREPHVEAGLPPVVYVGDEDPELGPWLDWVGSDGRTTFARFVATHPLYLVTEPLRSPERAFNNALGDREFYAPPDLARLPLVDRVLALPTTVVLMVAAVVGGWAFGRRRWTPAVAVGVVTAALAVPHGLLAWHSDGMETARHLVVPALQLHLGVLLMVVGTLPAAPGHRPADQPADAG
jgi:hypothetical protein